MAVQRQPSGCAAGHDEPRSPRIRGHGQAHGGQQRLHRHPVGRPGQEAGTSEIDWLYGSQRIFAFTFELYPKAGQTVGRFYPPDEVIDRQTSRNRAAVLYLIDIADCPYRAVDGQAGYCGPMYDDLEIARGWTIDPDGTDTADSGAWARGDPTGSTWQLGSAISGRAVLATGLARGRDVDGGRTTARSRFVHLPSGRPATLRLRYWAGMSSAASGGDTFRIEIVGRASATPLLSALGVDGDGVAHRPAWQSLAVRLPATLEGLDVAVQLVAVDSGPDATVEAGVDDVRITVADP